MTIKEIIEILNNYPDDTEVFIESTYQAPYKTMYFENPVVKIKENEKGLILSKEI